MRKRQYLRNNWSYRNGLALILTAMPTFLLHFQILKEEESNIKPKIANFYKIIWLKMAKYKKWQYLRNGWSYEDIIALVLTAMPTFLWGLQMLK